MLTSDTATISQLVARIPSFNCAISSSMCNDLITSNKTSFVL